MTDETDPIDETYHADARSWALDRAEGLARSARLGWTVAAVAVVIAGLEALALIALAPLKTVVPYTLLVDRTTGFTQTLEGTHPQAVKPQAALTQSLLAQYVVARENYDINSLAENYRKVALFSAGEARGAYLALMPATNPQSPLNLYPRAALVQTSITAVTPAGPTTARVHFVTERRDTPTAAPQRSFWVAEIDWRFTGEPASADDRLVNPLGFAVTRYRRDQEALPQGMAPAPQPVAISPAGAPAGYPTPIGPRGATP